MNGIATPYLASCPSYMSCLGAISLIRTLGYYLLFVQHLPLALTLSPNILFTVLRTERTAGSFMRVLIFQGRFWRQ